MFLKLVRCFDNIKNCFDNDIIKKNIYMCIYILSTVGPHGKRKGNSSPSKGLKMNPSNGLNGPITGPTKKVAQRIGPMGLSIVR